MKKRIHHFMNMVLNKYFNFLDIINEGYRRLVLISILLVTILLWLFWVPTLGHPDSEFGGAISSPLIAMLIVSLIAKAFTWVKSGFKND